MNIAELAAREKVKAATEREQNRARMAAWNPDCLRLIDQLKAEGMLGRVVLFEVFE